MWSITLKQGFVRGVLMCSTISSTQNETIKGLKRLEQSKERQRTQTFLVEGYHLVEEALRSGRLKAVYKTVNAELPSGIASYTVIDEKVAHHLSQTNSGSNLFGLVAMVNAEITQPQRVILCDGIQDPGNMGTIIRTALSFGFDGLYVNNMCVDISNDKVIRSAQGALFHLPIQKVDLLTIIPQLQAQGLSVVGTDVHQGQPLAQIALPQVALVLGSEGSGVSPEVLAACDLNVKIEMTTFESLNVASAAAILCYHFRRP